MQAEQNDFWFIPLGGTGEIGMNMNLYGHDGQWLMVDCGITFEKVGPRVQMADPQFIASQRKQLTGLVITHAHEDHIGAVPDLWSQLRCPIYTTPFTAEVLQRKLRAVQLIDKVPIIIVDDKEIQRIGVFNVEWIPLTHSIPEAYGILITTPAATVFHTADWKLDPEPVVGLPYQPHHYQQIGRRRIDAMICDSTNAMQVGWSASEGSLQAGLLQYIAEATGRVVVTCFGSNLARLKTLADIAHQTGRHIGILGRAMNNMLQVAKACRLWPEETTIVDSAHLGYLPPETLLLIVTGSQGEARSALSRLSLMQYHDIALAPGDTVIFSAKAIPGNETDIEQLINRLTALSIRVITDENSDKTLHASGHPAQQELHTMYQWVQPRCAIPVHGEAAHIYQHAKLAKAAGIPHQLVGENGDVFFIAPAIGIKRKAVPVGRLGRDDKGLITVG